MPFGIQPGHLVFIFIVALIVFGPKRLPEVGRWVGRIISEFRSGTSALTEALSKEALKDSSAPKAASPQPPAPKGSTPVQGTQPVNTIHPPTQPWVISANQKFCPTCSAINPDEALFCMKCGSQFPASNSTTPEL